MSDIHAGTGIDVRKLKSLHDLVNDGKIKKISLHEMPEERFQSYIENHERFLESRYSSISNYHGNPVNDAYAHVVKGGEVVAKIYNHGGTETANALSGLTRNLPGDINGQTGPVLAEARAAMIAEMTGGTVEKLPSAISQREYLAAPKPSVSVDYEAMREDKLFENLTKLKQARTEYLAHRFAQAD